MGLVVGIDASRNRSGGAKAHLVGILGEASPLEHEIESVHVWSYRTLLDALPDAPWLIKHNPPALERSLIRQVSWQYLSLAKEAQALNCTVMLSTDAGSVCGFRPSVVMSRDMLSYEPGEMQRYGFSKARLRLLLLRYIQARSLRRAEGAIFLTDYAARVIQNVTGGLPRVSVIPHGVGARFKQATGGGVWRDIPGRSIRCLYVSNAALYKHQWNVVDAIGQLRRRGYNLSLLLAGGGSGRAQKMLDEQIAVSDPSGDFVESIGAVPHDQIPSLLAGADIFIFASSCENMPNTLIEAMASGLPVACSDRGPMPEVLKDGGVYFDPENAISIAAAVEEIIVNPTKRLSIAQRAKALSERYSWRRCGSETWEFVREIAQTAGVAATLVNEI